jgi:hypothetical protein
MVGAVKHFRREAAEADRSFRIWIGCADSLIATLAEVPGAECAREDRPVGHVEEHSFWVAEGTSV